MRQRSGRIRSRSGSILFVVVLALAIAALVTAGMIQGAGAARAAGLAGADRDQLRSLAWSGVLASMTELGAQRDALLKGKDPVLTSRWTLFTSGGFKGTVSLQAFGAKPFASECARLDLNGANEADLARVSELANDAGQIAGGTWTSPEELREVVGKGGPKLKGLASDGEKPKVEAGEPESLGTSETTAEAPAKTTPAWLSRVTVFSADAQAARSGADRIAIGGAWDGASAKAVAGDNRGVDAVLEALAADTKRPTTMAGLVAWLGAQNTPLAEWGRVLDVFCDAPGVRTRVLDINRAEAGTIAGLPGSDTALADKLVAARQRLGEDSLTSLAWPVEAGVLTPAQLAPLLPRITTRSLVWRVRVVAEISTAGDEAQLPEVAGLGVDRPPTPGTTPAPPAGLRLVYDAVIDVTGTTPRVAYLRDGTWDSLTMPMPPEKVEKPALVLETADALVPPVLPEKGLGEFDDAKGGGDVTVGPNAPTSPPAENAAAVRGPRVGRWVGGGAHGN
ncbi:MAG: hypothetical protein WC718_05350 [Phycisphaerales bacterium]|jgi:hypothetical protein